MDQESLVAPGSSGAPSGAMGRGLAVLEEKVTRLESEMGLLRGRMLTLEDRLQTALTEIAVLKVRVGLYAGLGAVVGGAIMTLILNAR